MNKRVALLGIVAAIGSLFWTHWSDARIPSGSRNIRYLCLGNMQMDLQRPSSVWMTDPPRRRALSLCAGDLPGTDSETPMLLGARSSDGHRGLTVMRVKASVQDAMNEAIQRIGHDEVEPHPRGRKVDVSAGTMTELRVGDTRVTMVAVPAGPGQSLLIRETEVIHVP